SRFAFAASRPSCSSSIFPRRITQRSQRTPVSWIVSVWTATALRYRALDQVCADSLQRVGSADLELPVAFAAIGLEPVDAHGQFARELRHRQRHVPVRMHELPVRPESRGGPTVLLV